MAQKSEIDDILELKVPTESPILPTTSTTTTSGCGSVGPAHAHESTRIDRADQAGPSTEESSSGPSCVTEERKRGATMDVIVGSGEESVKKAVKRCAGCRKRVGLTGFRCRCGDVFCGQHRYSDRHDCSFDYKTAGRQAIARENPVVRAAKILKV